ncbi:MAG: hypothetical protein DRR06_16620 [Gammaproteobacteria bacterium]|nr:MAG: hypothetical protein DRR06_16620 [Gammaproteobacteria bacterium]RLA44537.1 MAG: hypothetical protein DRR42_20355 [Gammaproteobacteria bacterium]
MTKFFSPADRAEDWQQLLAKPNLHWKTGYSAKSLAHSWTEAAGFPSEVSEALEASGYAALKDLQFLLGFPEYDVPLPGGRRPSQNDVFVLARNQSGLVTIAVEGKVSEPFDQPVGERFSNPTPGQTERLTYLCDLLQLQRDSVDNIGYQLLHRSASALIEAERFGATYAIMLVHSFSESLEHFDDFANFAALYGIDATPHSISRASRINGIDFYLSWVVGNPGYLSR